MSSRSFHTVPPLAFATPVSAPQAETEAYLQAKAQQRQAREDEAVLRAGHRIGIGPGTNAAKEVSIPAGVLRAALREAYRQGAGTAQREGKKNPRRAYSPAGRV